jgi:hypothetical protein
MVLNTLTRASAIGTLKAIRSKAIDTERRLLLDNITTGEIIERAEQIKGLTHVLAMSTFEDPNSVTDR